MLGTTNSHRDDNRAVIFSGSSVQVLVSVYVKFQWNFVSVEDTELRSFLWNNTAKCLFFGLTDIYNLIFNLKFLN